MMDSEKLVEEFSKLCDRELEVCKEWVEKELGQCLEKREKVDRKDEVRMRGYGYFAEGAEERIKIHAFYAKHRVNGALSFAGRCYARGLMWGSGHDCMIKKNVAVLNMIKKLKDEAVQEIRELEPGNRKELEKPESPDQKAAIAMVSAFFD